MIIPDSMIVHIAKIFEGEYEIPFNHPNPKIIDVGANVGGFSLWAKYRWPGASIDAYEPVLDNFKLLEKNARSVKSITCHKQAVAKTSGTRKIYYGKHNPGECSFHKGHEQTDNGEDVQTIAASKLPECDIMKIDTEGAEVEIVENLVNWPKIFLIEYHGEHNRARLNELLKDYVLFYASSTNAYTGILKYAHKDIVKESEDGQR